MDKIFVQIASYRDPELLPTLRDCLAKAKYPERLTFGICWQRDEWENLAEFEEDPRFRIITIPWRESQGVCWARNLIQQQYQGEAFTLHLDAHHRFLQDWDELLIHTIMRLKKFSSKPLLTGYPPAYRSEDGYMEIPYPRRLAFQSFSSGGVLLTKSIPVRESEIENEAIPARFLAAGFCFTLGRFCEEVPHDPNLYCIGEEPSLAARAYTHGYDMFHPVKWVVWHEYSRKDKRLHWEDHDAKKTQKRLFNALDLELKSLHRYRVLMQMKQANIDFGKWGLGSERNFEAFEKFVGIKFSLKAVDPNWLRDKLPTKRPSSSNWTKKLIKPKWLQISHRRETKPHILPDHIFRIRFNDLLGNTVFERIYSYQKALPFFKRQKFYFHQEILSLSDPVSWRAEILDNAFHPKFSWHGEFSN